MPDYRRCPLAGHHGVANVGHDGGCSNTNPHGVRPIQALQFAMVKAWPTHKLTARMASLAVLSAVPFLAVAAVYFTLLNEFDINFYLTKKPPVFYVAISIGVALAIAMVAVWLRLFTGWIFAWPIVLFENSGSCKAIASSRERAAGQRRRLLSWISAWSITMVALSALATSVVNGAGRYSIPLVNGSLQVLSFAIGLSPVAWSVVNQVMTLLSTTTLAILVFHLYRQYARGDRFDSKPLNLAKSARDIPGFRFTPARLLTACGAGLAIALATGYFLINSIPLEDQVDVIAHQGASKAAPENTMASVRQAIADGTDWVEIDVQEAAHGTVVVFHDSDFRKLSGVNLKTWDATMEDLKNIDIGS